MNNFIRKYCRTLMRIIYFGLICLAHIELVGHDSDSIRKILFGQFYQD
jgi:hypothetical protein